MQTDFMSPGLLITDLINAGFLGGRLAEKWLPLTEPVNNANRFVQDLRRTHSSR